MKSILLVGAGLVVCGIVPGAAAAPLISASGLDGAGLGLVPEQRGRAWGEMAFHTQEDFTILAPTLGVGFMPIEQLELSLVLPFTYVSADDGDAETALGNVYLGVSYVTLDGPERATFGLGFAVPTAPDEGAGLLSSELGMLPHGYQHKALRIPRYTGVVAPLHIETGGVFVGSLDGSLQLLIPTDDAPDDEDSRLEATLAPGFGIRIGGSVVLGLRVPMWLYLLGDDDDDDRAQVTVEPFARFNVGSQGFLGVRFNMPVDKPLTDEHMWGLHLGGGAAF